MAKSPAIRQSEVRERKRQNLAKAIEIITEATHYTNDRVMLFRLSRALIFLEKIGKL